MSGFASIGGRQKRRCRADALRATRPDPTRPGSQFCRPKSSAGSGPGEGSGSPDQIPKLPADRQHTPPASEDFRCAEIGQAQSCAPIGPIGPIRGGRLWGEGGSDAEFDLGARRQTVAGQAPPRNARTPNRALYIPWGRNRSSLSRLGQLEQPRQQTSSTATPTVTRMATRLPFIENQ
jgi:hypothetical protein